MGIDNIKVFFICLVFMCMTGIVSGEPNSILVNGKKFYPVGTYSNTASLEKVPELASYGFNTILTYLKTSDVQAARKQLDYIHSYGLKVIVNYADMMLLGRDNEVITHIKGIKDHPALLGYYIADEPEGTWHKHPDYSPFRGFLKTFIHKRLSALKNAIRDPLCDPNPEHYIMMCVAWEKNYDDFADIYDVNLADNYQPITADYEFGKNDEGKYPWIMPADAGRGVEVARRNNKTCMFVSHGANNLGPGDSDRPPTRKEFLYSTFSAVTRLVNGSMHWSLYRITGDYGETVVFPVTQLLGSLKPYLEGSIKNDMITSLSRYTFTSSHFLGPFQNTNIPHVYKTPHVSTVLYRHKDNENKYILIIVNNYMESQQFTLTLGGLDWLPAAVENSAQPSGPVLFEGDKKNILTDVLAPFDVHIYRIDCTVQ